MKITQLTLMLTGLALAGPSAASPTKNANVPEVSWRQSPIVLMPGVIPAEERKIKENETFISLPLRWAKSTKLQSEVSFALEGASITIPAGEILPFVVINTGVQNKKRFAYCVRNKTLGIVDKNTSKGALFGLVSTDKKFRQVCLEDRDNDRKFEKVILLSMVSGVTDLAEINPINYENLNFEIIDDSTDYIKIYVWYIQKKNVNLKVDIILNNRKVKYSDWQSGRFYTYNFNPIFYVGKRKGPKTMVGIKVDIVEANKSEKWATLQWKPIASQKDIITVPELVTTTWHYNFY